MNIHVHNIAFNPIVMKIPFILNLTSKVDSLIHNINYRLFQYFPCCVYFLFQGVNKSQNLGERGLNWNRSLS